MIGADPYALHLSGLMVDLERASHDTKAMKEPKAEPGPEPKPKTEPQPKPKREPEPKTEPDQKELTQPRQLGSPTSFLLFPLFLFCTLAIVKRRKYSGLPL